MGNLNNFTDKWVDPRLWKRLVVGCFPQNPRTAKIMKEAEKSVQIGWTHKHPFINTFIHSWQFQDCNTRVIFGAKKQQIHVNIHRFDFIIKWVFPYKTEVETIYNQFCNKDNLFLFRLKTKDILSKLSR